MPKSWAKTIEICEKKKKSQQIAKGTEEGEKEESKKK